MMSAIFVTEGIDTLRNPRRRVETAEPVAPKIAEKVGLPTTDTEMLVKVNAAVQVGAGTLLALGKFRRLSAMALIGSLIPTTYAGHRFWEVEDPAARSQQRIQFMKNLSMLGGLILAVVDTEGAPSVGWRARRVARRAGTALTRGSQVGGAKAGAAQAKVGAVTGRVGATTGRAGRKAGKAAGKAAAKANKVAAKAAAKGIAKANKGAAKGAKKAERRVAKLAAKAGAGAGATTALIGREAARAARAARSADIPGKAAHVVERAAPLGRKAARQANKAAAKAAARAGEAGSMVAKKAAPVVSEALSSGGEWASEVLSAGGERAGDLLAVGARRAGEAWSTAAEHLPVG